MNRGLLAPGKRSTSSVLPSMVGVSRRIGYASSAAAFTTTSTSLVDITAMSVTVVHTRTGFLTYQAHLPSCRSSSAGAYLGVALLRDATTIDQSYHTSSAATEWGTVGLFGVVNLAAGTYTFKLQLASSTGSSTAAVNDSSLGLSSLAIWEDIA